MNHTPPTGPVQCVHTYIWSTDLWYKEWPPPPYPHDLPNVYTPIHSPQTCDTRSDPHRIYTMCIHLYTAQTCDTRSDPPTGSRQCIHPTDMWWEVTPHMTYIMCIHLYIAHRPDKRSDPHPPNVYTCTPIHSPQTCDTRSDPYMTYTTCTHLYIAHMHVILGVPPLPSS